MRSLKQQLLPIMTYVRIDIRRLFRDKVAVFFVFLFPLIFLMIFGSIFNSNDGLSFNVALINNGDSSFSKKFVDELAKDPVFKLDTQVTSMEAARDKMSHSQIDAIIVLPADFGAYNQRLGYPTGTVDVLYAEDNESAGSSLAAIIDGVFKQINQQIAPYTPPLQVTARSTGEPGLRQFDYTFSGLFGFTLLSLGIFGPSSVFPKLKTRGVLRRYRTTTITTKQYFLANVLSNALLGILSAGVMVLAALMFFDLQMKGNYLNLAVIAVIGTVLMFGFGLAIGGWARNEAQAQPVAQLVGMPMMFLSGAFIPTFLMPGFLQKVSEVMPLNPIIDSVRLIVTENASLLSLASEIGLILGWTIIIYLIAFRVFRWE